MIGRVGKKKGKKIEKEQYKRGSVLFVEDLGILSITVEIKGK